jgi:hypothetical protein
MGGANPLASGRSPAACRIAELLECCPSARGTILPQNRSARWTWAAGAGLSIVCTYNSRSMTA